MATEPLPSPMHISDPDSLTHPPTSPQPTSKSKSKFKLLHEMDLFMSHPLSKSSPITLLQSSLHRLLSIKPTISAWRMAQSSSCYSSSRSHSSQQEHTPTYALTIPTRDGTGQIGISSPWLPKKHITRNSRFVIYHYIPPVSANAASGHVEDGRHWSVSRVGTLAATATATVSRGSVEDGVSTYVDQDEELKETHFHALMYSLREPGFIVGLATTMGRKELAVLFAWAYARDLARDLEAEREDVVRGNYGTREPQCPGSRCGRRGILKRRRIKSVSGSGQSEKSSVNLTTGKTVCWGSNTIIQLPPENDVKQERKAGMRPHGMRLSERDLIEFD